MRLRAIEVKNWGCIESLSLADLRDGVIVLHGPNRTGKSSLAQAIRSGLFDHFHDSQEGTLLAAVPWKTKAAPHVAIEFEHAGQRYRITKTFARTKEGQATLEQQSASGWTVLVRGKDAAKKVRELIGVESSEAGVFQMLWLGQRDFVLPRQRAVDSTLTKALEAVLGTLITGHDIDFKERLDKACERWFTVKTMQDKKAAPPTKLSADLEAAIGQKAEIDFQWNEAESALRQYDEAVAREPELERQLSEAESELETIRKVRESITMRQSQHALARKHCESEKRQLDEASKRRDGWDSAQKQSVQIATELREAELQQANAASSMERAQAALDEARLGVEKAELTLARHRQTRSALDDRHELLTLATQAQALAHSLLQVEEWSKSLHELEGKLAGPPAPNKEEIDQLQHNRQDANRLRAQLEAGEIQVAIRARAPLVGEITLDGQPRALVSLPADGSERWLIRQAAELMLGDLATIHIGRGKEDQNLEQLAQKLAELDRAYRVALTAARIEPDLPGAIDALTVRRLEREAHGKEYRRLRDAVTQASPGGLVSLQAQQDHLRERQEPIFTRRAELLDWTPTEPELKQLRDAFEHQESTLQSQLEKMKKDLASASQSVECDQTALQAIKTRVASLKVELRSVQEKVDQQDRAALAALVDEAKTRFSEAEAKVLETTLTDAELAVESRFQAAASAVKQRGQRARDNEDALLRLHTQLAGTEGLHQKRIQAEQTVNDLTRDLARERLHAQAHKHLKDLFEQVHQEQVRRTVGPINDRVMQWAKQLGLIDYAGLSFGDQLLPAGLVPIHAVDGEVVEMERESYGTLEQLSLLIRLAVGGLLSRSEPAVAILDDPLAHADLGKHRKMLEIFDRAAHGEAHGPHPTGPLQLIVLTCHADRFDYLDGAQQFDLARLIQRVG